MADGICTNHRCHWFERVVVCTPGDRCIGCDWRLEHHTGLTFDDAAAKGYGESVDEGPTGIAAFLSARHS